MLRQGKVIKDCSNYNKLESLDFWVVWTAESILSNLTTGFAHKNKAHLIGFIKRRQ